MCCLAALDWWYGRKNTIMKTRTSSDAAIAIAVQARIGDIKQHVYFRMLVFVVAVLGGYFFSRLVCAGFRSWPSLISDLHAQIGPVLETLKARFSVFGT